MKRKKYNCKNAILHHLILRWELLPSEKIQGSAMDLYDANGNF